MSFIDVLKVAVPLATAVLGGDEDMANPLKQENPYKKEKTCVKGPILIADDIHPSPKNTVYSFQKDLPVVVYTASVLDKLYPL